MGQRPHGAYCTTTAVLMLLAMANFVAEASPKLVGSRASVVELTATIMSKMKSPLLKSEATAYMELYKQTGSVGNLCEIGHLYCNAQTYKAYYEKVLQPEDINVVEVNDIAVFFRESELLVGRHVTIVDPRLQSTAIERNLQALAGKTNYYNINAKMPERAFLPTELAQKLPFSSDSATQIFGIDKSSALARESSKTVELCNKKVHRDGTTTLKGEAAGCATSLEGLQSLLQSPKLLGTGSEVEALTMGTSLHRSFTGQVVELRLKAIEKMRHVVCHNVMYPSAVYFCHYLPNTRVYAVSLQETPKKELLQAVAMCHLDTSGWNPEHLAFQNLGTLPGQSEACHWVLPGSVVFVAAA